MPETITQNNGSGHAPQSLLGWAAGTARGITAARPSRRGRARRAVVRAVRRLATLVGPYLLFVAAEACATVVAWQWRPAAGLGAVAVGLLLLELRIHIENRPAAGTPGRR
jgi:NhaP-type Na+/H+ or K+/H+ antiporter